MFESRKPGSIATSNKGELIIPILTVLGIAGIATIALQLFQNQLVVTQRKNKNGRFSVHSTSAIETMALAYRWAEIAYTQGMSACTAGTANPFLVALQSGHGCTAGITDPIRVFAPSDYSGNADISSLFSYVYPTGCEIRQAQGLICPDNTTGTFEPVKLLTIGIGTAGQPQRIDSHSFEFVFNAIVPKKGVAEFVASITSSTGGTPVKRGFAIRTTLSNAAHLEGDGRVTQESPDPLSRCPGTPFADLQIYDSDTRTCQSFAQLGSGTGLAFYDGRFFGFRPFDGQVVDLLSASGPSPNYLVDEDTGKTCPSCPRIFPSHIKESLINVDDITLIDSQIYYVAGQGTDAVIGSLTLDTNAAAVPADATKRIPLCPLGELGWSQAYSGIGTLSWSDALIPSADTASEKNRTRIATFFLKTDSGGLLTAAVTVKKKGGSPVSSNCREFTYAGAHFLGCCSVYKDINLQQIEYARTLGFDRTETAKPYYLY